MDKRELEKLLAKRKWKPAIKDGKLFTGWDGVSSYQDLLVDEPHKVWELELRPTTYARGRSAADIIFEDREGVSYHMKLSSAMELIKALFDEKCELVDGFMFAKVIQVKKGANVAIEAVFDG